jgi:hypothetical protein
MKPFVQKITINGKTYKYGGWAACAYKFMLLSNEIEPEIASASEIKPKSELIKIFKKSKELRGKDFLAIAAKKMAAYLQNYDAYKNGYIPEITADYMEEFANSDSMQVDIEILTDTIEAIQKLYLHLKIPFEDLETINEDLKTINEDLKTINYIENLQYLLINLCIHI